MYALNSKVLMENLQLCLRSLRRFAHSRTLAKDDEGCGIADRPGSDFIDSCSHHIMEATGPRNIPLSLKTSTVLHSFLIFKADRPVGRVS